MTESRIRMNKCAFWLCLAEMFCLGPLSQSQFPVQGGDNNNSTGFTKAFERLSKIIQQRIKHTNVSVPTIPGETV